MHNFGVQTELIMGNDKIEDEKLIRGMMNENEQSDWVHHSFFCNVTCFFGFVLEKYFNQFGSQKRVLVSLLWEHALLKYCYKRK